MTQNLQYLIINLLNYYLITDDTVKNGESNCRDLSIDQSSNQSIESFKDLPK